MLTVLTQGELKKSGLVGPLCVSAVVFFGATAIGPISGGAFNPAVGMGTNFVDSMNHSASRSEHVWLYIFAPIVGSVIVAAFYLSCFLIYAYSREQQK